MLIVMHRIYSAYALLALDAKGFWDYYIIEGGRKELSLYINGQALAVNA